MKMPEYHLTVGLFSQGTCTLQTTPDAAKTYIRDLIVNQYGLYGFTMIDCSGGYRMQKTGKLVFEPSIRIEIVSTDGPIDEKIEAIAKDLCDYLNQESVMIKWLESDIDFTSKK